MAERVGRHRLIPVLLMAVVIAAAPVLFPSGYYYRIFALVYVFALAALGLTPIPVTRGTVELTGWVPDRSARARAVRLAAQVPGLTDLINSILVHGEDDLGSPELSLEGRSA